jgi:hypothetical protein
MTGILAAGLRVEAGVITGWVIAMLSIVTAIVIIFGVLRAIMERRRPQVVVNDVELDEGVPAESVAGLSQQLRQAVRRALRWQGDDARQAEIDTLEEDIQARLVTVHGAAMMQMIVADLVHTTGNSISALQAGLRAVGPKEAEGLAAALELAMPAQRGWTVRSFPSTRGRDEDARVGLSLEMARLGRAPDAVTTFWTTSDALQKADSDEARLAAIHELLHELVEPASVWIAIRLVSRHLKHAHHWNRGLPTRRSRELAGLQLQLAGQMLLYSTRTQAKFVTGIAYEALDDLDQAAVRLPDYYRPHLTQAAVYERRAWFYRRSGDDQRAQRDFTRAVDAYDKAAELLGDCRQADPGKRDAAIERLALRRTKCRLLSGDDEYADVTLKELSAYSPLKDRRPGPLYNAACLFAVAMASPNLPGDQRALSEWRAWHYLGHALVLSSRSHGPWSRMMTDEELDTLDVNRRKDFGDQIKKESGQRSGGDRVEAEQIVEAATAALGLRDPRPQGAA